MEKKRNVIFVNSLFNIIMAVLIRKKIYMNDSFDIVISSLSPGLDDIFDRKILEECFDHVYYVDYNKVSRLNKIQALLVPETFFKNTTGHEFIEYTDIFFWNPTLFFYFYLFECKRRKKSTKLHLYGDAMGAYMCDAPNEKGIFREKIINEYLKIRFSYQPVRDMVYDYYIMKPEYRAFDTEKEIVEVPVINKCDTDILHYLNRIFEYSPDIYINQKYIFMDVIRKEKFDDSQNGDQIIKTLLEILPTDDFILKPHPRQDKKIYNGIDLTLMELNIPWEIYCANIDINNKVIISFGSSSAFLPLILWGCNYTLICIDLPNSLNTIYSKEWKRFLKNLYNKGKNIHTVMDAKDLRNLLIGMLGDGKE